MKVFSGIVLLFLTIVLSGQDKKLLTPTPPMGWNSWNWFGKTEINEQNMRECIDAIVDQGLLDAGYKYFVIDGGWRDTKLGPDGELLAHSVKFPHGMKALADYAHSKGLKFGLHTVPGTHDCGGDLVGGFGHEEVHIKQFVDWGLDFIKLDKCRYTDGWNEELVEKTYRKWSDLLSKCGRDIVLSISAYQWRDWYPQVGQMARTTRDITAKCNTPEGALFDPPADLKKRFLSVMEIAEINNKSAEFAGNGYWNDPDMLATGEQGLSLDEQKSHFALWCIMSSPLVLGNDPRKMTTDEKEIILNKIAISIDQDPSEQGKRIKKDGDIEVWLKQIKDGQKALLILNRNSNEIKDYKLDLSEFGISEKVRNITDVYSGVKMEPIKESLSFKINPHACIFLKVEKGNNKNIK
ncbi:MAG TPA: glycoside hydrolase family 27 protein [Bacteroidales bacterium]|nr:glycoside hydrolase family 27 protein [Bacteroidales bacterium]